MPNTNRQQTLYVSTGNFDTVNDSATYSATKADSPMGLNFQGQLGMAADVLDRAYQYVQLDSGATSATAVGVVAANQLAFWKDRSQYLVTNDKAQADLGPTNYFNSVAGIFRNAVTAGNYTFILQRGRKILVTSDGSGAVGDYAVAKQAVSTAAVTNVAAGTAPVSQTVGVIAAVASGGNITVDVDIPNIP